MPASQTKADPATTAKLLVVLLAFAWGLNWIAAAIALRELSPWSLRVAGSSIGAATLFAAAILSGHNLKVPRGEYIHIMIAGLFNVAGFQILSGFAQLSGATTRAIIITYSMPIWTTVLSCLVLGERLNAIRWFAFGIVHRRCDGFVVATICARISSIRILLAWLRAELDIRHRLHQMGEYHGRAIDKCSLAIVVRPCVHHCRFVPI